MWINITIIWKLFRYGVKIDQYEKLIGIRELSERLALDWSKNYFSTDTGTRKRTYLPLMRYIKERQFLLDLWFIFKGLISPSTEVRNISNITLNSASSISYNLVTSTVEYQNTAEIKEAIQGGIYKRIARGYCSGRLTNGKIFLKRNFSFYNDCDRFNKKTYHCQQVVHDCFAMHNEYLVSLPWHDFSCSSILFCCLICNNDDCLGYQLATMMNFMPIRIYKRKDLS